jgi:Mrp family chromosome partitioning ATPase
LNQRGNSNAPGAIVPSPPTSTDLVPRPDDSLQLGVSVNVAPVHWRAPAQAPDLPFITAPDSSLTTSFRLLAHRIRDQPDVRVIAVTSPNDGEGKTTCAINLAMALAEHGRNTILLVEANRRRPRLASVLGMQVPICLSTQMWEALNSQNHSWEVVPAFTLNFHVLAFDPEKAEPRRIDAREFMGMMHELVHLPYRYIIVDCPPVLDSADVNVIEGGVDGVLLTARAGVTTNSQLRSAVESLAPVRMLGTVLVES